MQVSGLASGCRWFIGTLVALGPLGCLGSGEAQYGDVAQYSPVYRAYVVTKEDSRNAGNAGGTAVAPSGNVLVLRDPITLDKLRCRESLPPWMDAQGRGADVNVRLQGSVRNTGIAMSPFVVVGAVVGGALLAVGFAPYFLAHPPSGDNWYDRGTAFFREGKYEDARSAFETSLSADAGERTLRSYALYYLGLSYEQLRQDDRAREALTTFVRRTAVANAAEFQAAEERLARLGAPIPSCESTARVPMKWSER